ncbi:MAG: 4Fe-4S binding protein [gamma proteobacterium endosymbiont of Lamellibrachia anaximandri]|nr:4Fe-4S binding protein [gamma proteobacterium endosymbiont of Lamellibrachia anaximandri]MBL3618345.1 4Fe-4S binding protein [gamma proteobacterium endosymbiont of Lamellibrachia anaximandri]
MGPNIRNQIEQALLELKQPEVVEAKCVHSLMASASCCSCVDACPEHAWILSESVLGLDTGKCDGCGLCVPACPEGAIQRLYEPLLCNWNGRDIVFVACEWAGVKRVDGVLPCVHSIGMRDLLILYQKGAKDIIVTRGDCAKCERGDSQRVGQAVIWINQMLTDRDIRPMRCYELTPERWTDSLNTVEKYSNGPEMGRRAFLRKTFVIAVSEQSVEDKLSGDIDTRSLPIGRLLPPTEKDALLPFVPIIDASRCNGCDTCVKLCPHDAITLNRDDETEVQSYGIQSENCSDCGICVDGCEVEAIAIKKWSVPDQIKINLTHSRCTACGADYHMPEVMSQTDESLCRICRVVNHYRSLYQVRD